MRPNKLSGSVLTGEVKPPRDVTFAYRPPSHHLGGYRDIAKRHEPSLSLQVSTRSAFSMADEEVAVEATPVAIVVKSAGEEQRLEPHEVEQFYVARSTGASGFSLIARVEGRDAMVIDNLRSERVAVFVEQLLEEFYALTDNRNLDLRQRLAVAPSRVLFNSDGVRAELVSEKEHGADLAHLRIRTTRPIGCAVPIILFMLVHNTLFFGGFVTSILGIGVGLFVGLAIGLFWSFWLFRSLVNRMTVFADDRTLSMRTGPLSRKRHPLVALEDVDAVSLKQTHTKINEVSQYQIVLKIKGKDVPVLQELPPKTAEALGDILEDHIIEVRQWPPAPEEER